MLSARQTKHDKHREMQARTLGAPRALILVLAAFFTLMGAVGTAKADRKVSLLSGSAELFGSKAVDDPNRDRFGIGVGGALYLELNITDWLGAQVGGRAIWFSAKDDPDSTTLLGLAIGPRLHWLELFRDSQDDGWFDLHYVFAESGDIRRNGLDLGLGYEFALNSTGKVRLGPFLRYQWSRAPDDPAGTNPSILMFGVSLSVGKRNAEKDSDKDGVPDSKDHCPDIHKGPNPDPNRPGCPYMDKDGDGVADSDDMCPELHAGERPDPKRKGCPVADKDKDTVPDVADACPDVPGAPTTNPETNGCPGLVQVSEGKIEINKPVFFAFNKDRILEASYPVLRAVAEAIEASPWINGVRIEGHTDSVGPDKYNLELSQRRADSVMRMLLKQGVAKDKLEAKGYGETQPIESNNTPEGRATNRRVEFHIVGE